MRDALRRTVALSRKEFYQIVRDPSSILIAFVLPLILIFIFGYGINLDSLHIRIALVLEDRGPEAARLASAFADSPGIQALAFARREDAERALVAGGARGVVVIHNDFAAALARGDRPPVQVITDGTDPNTASFVAASAEGAWARWLEARREETALPAAAVIDTEPRYWYNPAAISRYFLIPGSIVIIMTVVGALLTSLVVAREWERGTMEALLSTPVTRTEFLLSKLIPYYLLGMASMAVCWTAAVTILGAPFRGSVAVLAAITTLFLGGALGLGLVLSTALRNQFNAAQAALNIAFLPAVMLSGFAFEISSMPAPVRAVTYLLPARYFVSSMHTLFLAGNVASVLVRNGLYMLVAAIVLLGWTARLTRRRLD
ncbi:MAG TPA: ABC transporter permease [Burkholderiaceae bacterium]|nr:ABC transporter permease [Burkholderiaceae bacterium]